MKAKFTRVGKRSISVILTLMMIMSTMLVGVVTTTAATNFTVYFEDTAVWNQVYVFLFKDNPWSDSNGVNVNGKYVVYSGMTEVGTSSSGKKIYSYEYTGSDEISYIAFAKLDQHTYGQFHGNEVSYTSIFTDSTKTLWTPDGTTTTKNSCTYYNSGSWSKYDSGSSGDTSSYYVAGVTALCGSDWSANDANNIMTNNADGTYSKTYKGKDAGTYQFKITDGSWTNNWGYSSAGTNKTTVSGEGSTIAGDNGNVKLTTTLKSDITITFNSSTNAISVVTTPEVSKYPVNFGSNNDTYGSVSATVDGSPITSGAEVASGKTVNFTASANDGYEVEGWYSNSSFSTKIDVAGTNTTYSPTATSETNVYVKFKKSPVKLAKPTITLDPATGIIPLVSGSSVKLTVSNHSSYPDDASVSYELYKGGTKVETASFIDGSCQITEAGTYTVKAISGNPSAYSDSDFSDAKEITKAQAGNYYIGGRFRVKVDGQDKVIAWEEKNTDPNFKFTLVDGQSDLYYLDTGCTLAELSDKVSSHNAFQFFYIYDQTNDKLYNAQNTSLQDCNSLTSAQKLELSDGSTDEYMRFSSSVTDGTVTLYLKNDNGTLKLYYGTTGGKTALDAPSITVDTNKLTTDKSTATITITPGSDYPDGTVYKLYDRGTYQDTTSGTTFTVTSGGEYTVKAVPPTDNMEFKESPDSNTAVVTDNRIPVTLNAMNGAKERTGEEKVNDAWPIRKIGTTVAEAANTSSSVSLGTDITDGKQYTVTKGSTVKVTTTMESTSTNEKYVYAFLVNNKYTYLATKNVTAEGENASYYAQFTIEQDATDTEFTVVPIYYYKACANEGEYIKLYVNTSDTENWGDIVYNYCYYYNSTGTDTKDTKESDGSWPGQPMLYDDTKQMFYTLVPKSINNQDVSGITVNNGSGTQTYDFDDFKYINESGYDIVRLDLKERANPKSNKDTIGAKYENSAFSADNPPSNISVFGERWQEYNDINGKPMSILGKDVDSSSANKLYVISTALYSIDGRGQYMTSWFVYKADADGNLTFVTAACPSDFIPRLDSNGIALAAEFQTDAYNKIVTEGLDNAPVQIVFENKASSRIDGRWYYAQGDSEVSAYAYYRVYDKSGNLVNTDWLTNPNAAYASVNGAVSVTNPKLGLEISVVASPLAGYVFDHWSIVDSKGNVISDNINKGLSFSTTLDQEVHYVANFVEAASGKLVISHGKYVGTDAKGGLGYYRLQVQVYRNGIWTDIKSGTGTGADGQSITIDIDSATDTLIRIKLITVTTGTNTFRYWYTTGLGGSEIIEDPDGNMTVDGVATTAPYGKKGTITYTFDTDVTKLFEDNVQKVTQMNFYSDITPVTNKFKLTYKYTDRFGKPKEYIVTGEHDDQYFLDNGNSWAPTDTLIKNNAPYIDDIYKNCNWVIESASKDGADAILAADQKGKTYKVTIKPDPDSTEDPLTYFISLNGYVKNDAKQFFVAPAKNLAGESFKYWSVKENGVEVARHNYLKYTLVVLGNYDITPVYEVDKKDSAFISKPQYTREQYTDASGEVVDTVYVDFMLDFVSATNELIRNNTSKYKTGILVELAQNYKLEHNTDANGKITVTNADYSSKTFESDKNQLEAAIATTSGTVTRYTYGTEDPTDKRIVYNFEADETKFNNLNRLQYFVPFKNSAKNQLYVMKAYFYVVVDGVITISDSPVYFNFYDIGSQIVS